MPKLLRDLLSKPFDQLGFRQAVALLSALAIVAAGTVVSTWLMQQRYQSTLANNLQTVLLSSDQAIRIWAREHYQTAQNFAGNLTLSWAAESLLFELREQKALLDSPEQAQLRRFFRPYLQKGQYRGFFIIGPDNISLASSRDANVGTLNLLTDQPDVLARMWRGETLLSRIQGSDVPLYTDSDVKQHATLFVGTPIRNELGEVIALLTLRIDPHNSLYPLLQQGRLGETGETYMFNQDGLMLNDSRFVEQLLEIGLLVEDGPHLHGKDNLSHHAHLQITLRDPGEDLTRLKRLPPGLSERPLTRMAASAIAGDSGVDLEGYRDYRGVPVVGAWLWDEELNVGLTTEQDVAEAYSLFYFVRGLIYGSAMIVMLILLLLTWVYIRGRRRLLASQNRLSAVVDNVIDAILVIDQNGIIESANPATESIFGYSTKLLAGNNISMLMPEPHASHHNGYIQRYLQSGEARIIGVGRELEARRADGTLFPIELAVSRLNLGGQLHFAGVIRDISVRKKAEIALENERIFTREVLDSLTAHIAVLDDKGTIVMTNEAWNRFGEENGLPAEMSGPGINYLDIVENASGTDSEEAPLVAENLRKILAGETDGFRLEYPCHSPGDKRWFYMRASQFLHEGSPAIVISHLDITQRMLSEQQLSTMSLVARNTDNAVIVTDVEGRITWVNDGFTRMSGYTLEEVAGRKPGGLLQGPDTDPEMVRHISQGLAAGDRVEGEILNYDKSGQPYWLHFEITPVLDENGRIVEFVALEQDITEEKRIMEALKLEKEATDAANNLLNLTREALERTGMGEFWIRARDGGVIRVNDHACNYLGYSREEMLELTVPDFDIKVSAENFRELADSVKEQTWARFESVHQTKQGRRIPVEITSLYLPDLHNYGEIFISFVADITQRKEAEIEMILAREEAEQANRAKSTFLATMSHEIRTPLNGVVGTVDLLSHTALDESQQDLVDTANDSAVLLQGIIDDILDFSKIEAGRLVMERVPLDMELLVEKLADNLQHLARSRGVELLIYCDPRLPEIQGDPVRLRQILFNLAGNAIKFSGGQRDGMGRVVIKILLEGQEGGNAALCMQISDNGIGMSEDVQARLFTPFVQGEGDITRRFGGTGLGLVITKRLVELMGGHIEVESTPGEGSTFSVHLAMKQADDSTAAAGTNLDGLQVVLVSNDEAGWILENYLGHAGAEITSATSDDLLETCRDTCAGSSEPVVVLDTQGEREMAPSLREKLRRELQSEQLRFVLVERGRRRYARPDENDSMTLDLNAMRRTTLLNAVASVVGRESPQLKMIEPEVSQLDMDRAQSVNNAHKILLADDNDTNRKVIGQQLVLLGYRAEFAENGSQALNMWREGGYSMVMTDCHMPEMDGYQLTRAIRSEEPDGTRIPVVAITADAMKGTAQKCFASGMDDYMTKPMQLAELRQTLMKWLPMKAEQDVEQPPAMVEEDEAAPGEAVDSHALEKLLGTQERESLAEFYSMFLETNAETATQIQGAYQGGDLSAVGQLAHKLKSAARTVGANRLADCCMRLETAGKEKDAQGVEQEMQRFPELFDQVRHWIEAYNN
ncbi:MAG: PAS domain S-box protein [Sedimenticola sp.]